MWENAAEWLDEVRREKEEFADEYSDVDLLEGERLRCQHFRDTPAGPRIAWRECKRTESGERLDLGRGILLPIPEDLSALQVWAEPDIPPQAEALRATERDAWFLMATTGGRWTAYRIAGNIHRASATVRGALAELYRKGLVQRYRVIGRFEWVAIDPRGAVIFEEKGMP